STPAPTASPVAAPALSIQKHPAVAGTISIDTSAQPQSPAAALSPRESTLPPRPPRNRNSSSALPSPISASGNNSGNNSVTSSAVASSTTTTNGNGLGDRSLPPTPQAGDLPQDPIAGIEVLRSDKVDPNSEDAHCSVVIKLTLNGPKK